MRVGSEPPEGNWPGMKLPQRAPVSRDPAVPERTHNRGSIHAAGKPET